DPRGGSVLGQDHAGGQRDVRELAGLRTRRPGAVAGAGVLGGGVDRLAEAAPLAARSAVGLECSSEPRESREPRTVPTAEDVAAGCPCSGSPRVVDDPQEDEPAPPPEKRRPRRFKKSVSRVPS